MKKLTTKEKVKKIKDYLRKNRKQLITVKKVKEETEVLYLFSKELNLDILTEIATNAKININFLKYPIGRSHGLSRYKDKVNPCKCKICKLGNAVYQKIAMRKKIPLSHFEVNFISNNYLKKYESDITKGKKKFYNFIEKKYSNKK